MKSGLINKLQLLCFILLFTTVFASGNEPVEPGAGLLSAEFVDADVRDVIRTLGGLAGINMVLAEDVTGKITISFKDVSFEDAIKAVMDSRGLSYEKVGSIMRIAPAEEIHKSRIAAEQTSALEVEIFVFKYVNALKVEPVIKSFISERGSVSIYHRSVRGGWPIVGIADEIKSLGPAPRAQIAQSEFPTMIVVRDTASRIELIRQLVEHLDTQPKQVLIEAVIAEIRYDDRRDIGINWETLTGDGAEGDGRLVIGRGREAGINLRTGEFSEPDPGFSGLGITYSRLSGARIRAELRALEVEGRATVLSSPRTLVLDGHEATVLVGLKHPIFETTLIGDIDPRVSESLSHYEPIGVLLRVVPAVWAGNLINMSVHPAVTALGDEVVGTTGIKAREIITQEVDTNITIESGDTVIIGGLIRDDTEFRHSGVPILSHIPVLGFFFRREKSVKVRQELLIFITPSVVEDSGVAGYDAERFDEYLRIIDKEGVVDGR